ncbi:MAG: hypothetical protein P8R42_12740 [Candidatus Binatia bacterium]|nr:hypothetical protein [Candidatus Binatia bacterium]
MLDLGSGLVDEMTGAENVRASLRLLGLGGRDLATAEQFVAGFADLGSFLLETVRVYSQGMRLRLAYAIAIATQPEVLITDEVLAVGDESFQRKCSRHMVDFVEGGGTLVLATHNLYLAEKLCGTALWLERGRERAVGPAGEVAKAYRDSLAGGWSEPRRSAVRAEQSSIPAGGRALAVLSGASVTTGGHVRMRFEDPWEISVPFAAEKSAAVREVEIDRPDGAVVARIPVDGWRGGVLTIPAGSILPGRYRLRLSDPSTSAAQETLWVECVGARREIGSVLLRHRWHRTSSKAAPEALWGS